MKKILLSVLIISLLSVVVMAQMERNRPQRPGGEVIQRAPQDEQASPEERLQQLLTRMMSRLELNDEQKKAVTEMVMLKLQTRREAQNELRALRTLARDENATDESIKEALMKFRQKRLEEKKKIAEIEQKAFDMLPVRAQLTLTIIGVFENGTPLQAPGGEQQRSSRQRMDRQRPQEGTDQPAPPRDR